MVFSSLIFLFVFLPITLVLYYIVPKPLKNPVLILCSLIFYAWETPQYLVLMLFSVVFNYCAGLELDDLHQRGKPKAAKWVMIAVVVMNLFLLGFFKYSGFLVENLNHIPGVALTAAKVALPVGISFYTFQVLSYVFDVYRQNVPVQRNFVLFATYVTFFPKLVSGPIVAYKDMEAQLRERQVSLDRICSGATLFLTGLFKKVLIADNLGVLYAGISGQSGAMSVVTAWLGAIGYTLQLYFDFSGYSDMAIGLGQMFGFDIDKNFDYPYLSKSITEFWRRWHISLSTWFREYLYIPLGGNRCSKGRWMFNLLVVWAATGIWHGASWNFVLWGLIFFVLIMLEKNIYGKLLNKTHVLKHVYIIFLIPLTWMVFAISDMHQLATYFTRLFPFLSSDTVTANTRDVMVALHNYWKILIPCVLFSTPLPLHYYKKYRKSAFCIILLIVIFILSIRAMMTQTNNPFLYFQF